MLAAIIAGYVLLAAHLSLSIPLGESPDEPAHFQYIQYIEQTGHLPRTQSERMTAGYRADWPPLYQIMGALVARPVKNDGVQSLKNVGENPRRLLPTDGTPPYTILHTDDESPPYTGIVRSWHAARFVSLLWGVLSLLLLYRLLEKQFSPVWALLGTVLVAVIPRYLEMSAVLNEDTLLAFLVLLYLNLLLPEFHRRGGWRRYAALGAVAGLALTAKYSALFLSLDVILLWLLAHRKPTMRQIAAYIGGMVIGAGWWFAFVVYHFNQIEALGWLKGSLAPFLLSGTDVASHNVAASLGMGGASGTVANIFSLDWLEWWRHFFVTFWFATDSANVAWGSLLMAVTIFVFGWIVWAMSRRRIPRRMTLFSAGHLLLFLPLPLLRYLLTQNIAETAQGRHLLFPTIFSLAALGVLALGGWWKDAPSLRQMLAVGVMVVFLAVEYGTFDFPKMTLAGIPPLPVRTTADFPPPALLLNEPIAGQTLVGVDFPAKKAEVAAYPITLRWHVEKPADADFSTRITLRDGGGNSVGLWLGMPVNGRYPVRAWETGDTIFDTVWVPMLANTTAILAQVELLSSAGDVISMLSFPVPAFSPRRKLQPNPTLFPRGDRLTETAPYSFHSTIALRIAGAPYAVSLRSPAGKTIAPAASLTEDDEIIALFEVDWTWDAGQYAVQTESSPGETQTFANVVSVATHQRRIAPPPMSHPLNANFADRFRLVGYDFPARATVQPGESFDVMLVWQSLAETTADYAVFNHLLNAGTQMQFGGRDRIPKNFYRTILWQKGEYVADTYAVPVRPDAPPGIYWLDVGLYPAGNAAARPLSLVKSGKFLPQNSVRLGTIKVGGAPGEVSPPEPPAHPADTRFGDKIVLSGYTVIIQPDNLQMKLYWSPRGTPAADDTLFVHIVNRAGQVVAQRDAPPLDGLYPTSFWAAGETIFDPRIISIATLPAGAYDVRIGWYNPNTGQRLPIADHPDGYITITSFSR